MKINKVANSIADEMNTYLESPEFKFLFKKADLLDDLASDEEGKDLDLDLHEEGHEGHEDHLEEDLGLDEGDEMDTAMADYEMNSNMAVDGLLTASAALDEINASEASSAVLKLASLVVEAKKKKVEDAKKEKEKAKKEKDKEKKMKEKAKEEKDKNDAKDKKMKEKAKKEKEEEKEKEKADKKKAKK